MKPIIKFSTTTLNGNTYLTAVNALNNKPIITRRAYDIKVERAAIEVQETASIIINIIYARWENFRRSGYQPTERTLIAFDNLKRNSQMLATFSNPHDQAKFIKRTLLKDLQIIAPRNERFQVFPRLIAHIEADPEANMQLDLFSVSH